MNNECLICLDYTKNFERILVVDANKIHEFIKALDNMNSLIVVPQTFCFDYPIALLNRAVSTLASSIRDLIINRLNIRAVSRNQLEKLIQRVITRKYVIESRKLRKILG